MQDTLIGGVYPISATIEWALTELVRHPAQLEKVQMEMIDVVGPYKIVDESEFSQISFFQVSLLGCFRIFLVSNQMFDGFSIQLAKIFLWISKVRLVATYDQSIFAVR